MALIVESGILYCFSGVSGTSITSMLIFADSQKQLDYGSSSFADQS